MIYRWAPKQSTNNLGAIAWSGLSGGVYKNFIPLLFLSSILSYFLKINLDCPPLSVFIDQNVQERHICGSTAWFSVEK